MPSDEVVLVAPLAPAPTGNGLAMRAGVFLEALSSVASVHLVIVPVAGSAVPHDWAERLATGVTIVDPVNGSNADEHVRRQLADDSLRSRLERTAPLPQRARLAPPTLAPVAARAVPSSAHGAVVVVLREYLVPFGVELARALDACRVVLDLDDDAEALLLQTGDVEEAAAYGRLAREWLQDADVVTMASPDDAARVRDRYGLCSVTTIPNAVRGAAPLSPPPGRDRLLYVGNLTYPPNAEAARVLVEEVLPIVRRARPEATATIVGVHAPGLDDLAVISGVEITGHVPDLDPWYARADAVVVPLRVGSGTRIKIIEAFSRRRPVIATPAAVAGLQVDPGRDVLVASTPAALADVTVSVLEDPARANAFAEAAYGTFVENYSLDAVVPLIERVALLR